MVLEPIRYKRGSLHIINQLLIPATTEYIPIETVTAGWDAIRQMKTRGAPAIAITGCLALAVELNNTADFDSVDAVRSFVKEKLDYLVTARPTAVNMSEAAQRFKAECDGPFSSVEEIKEKMICSFEAMLAEDIATNMRIGDHGARAIVDKVKKQKVRVLTHCNTGSLATAGYGTALGVIRSLHRDKQLDHAYCKGTETRPYNQGSRLTAYELVHEEIPSTLITDSMVTAAIKSFSIDAIVIGADRVARNGDTANKIGSCQLGVIARHFRIPLYIASPKTTIDLECVSGDEIIIEQRAHREVTHVGETRIAADGINVWNPAFDVVPAELITGIITEDGCFAPDQIKELSN